MANNQSADDALEEERQDEEVTNVTNPKPQLPEDNATPAAPADDNQIIPPDHPVTDTGMDEDELYEEGEGGAANLDEADDNIVPDRGKESDEYKF